MPFLFRTSKSFTFFIWGHAWCSIRSWDIRTPLDCVTRTPQGHCWTRIDFKINTTFYLRKNKRCWIYVTRYWWCSYRRNTFIFCWMFFIRDLPIPVVKYVDDIINSGVPNYVQIPCSPTILYSFWRMASNGNHSLTISLLSAQTRLWSFARFILNS